MNIELDVHNTYRCNYQIAIVGRSAEDGTWIELYCETPETHVVTRKYSFLWFKWEKDVTVYKCHEAAVEAVKNVKHVQCKDEWLDTEFQDIEVREQWWNNNHQYACHTVIWENGRWR